MGYGGILIETIRAVDRALRPPSGQEEGADLYFVFEGHFHCLQKGAVVGTISPGMLFGILEVFGISDLSEDMRIRSLSHSLPSYPESELCSFMNTPSILQNETS